MQVARAYTRQEAGASAIQKAQLNAVQYAGAKSHQIAWWNSVQRSGNESVQEAWYNAIQRTGFFGRQIARENPIQYAGADTVQIVAWYDTAHARWRQSVRVINNETEWKWYQFSKGEWHLIDENEVERRLNEMDAENLKYHRKGEDLVSLVRPRVRGLR